MRLVVMFLVGALACGDDSSADSGVDASSDAGADTRIPDPDVGPDAPLVDATDDVFDAAPDATPFECDYDDPRMPSDAVRWAAPLATDLGGHGHDDGFGPIGFCPGTPIAGEPFYRLVAAGFETDEDITGDGDQNDALTPGFHTEEPFVGIGESGGRVNIYVDVLDEEGAPLNRDSAPELAILREVLGFSVDRIPLDAKPPNEFQTNTPMTGGGSRFGIQIEGASDRVINMRLPVNHHVTYVLVFQRES